MQYAELTDEQKFLIESYHNKYVILMDHDENCSFQCGCEVTDYGIILHIVAKFKAKDFYSPKTRYTFEEFLDAVKNHKIFKGIV